MRSPRPALIGKGNGDGSKRTQFVAKTKCSDCNVVLTTANKKFGRCVECAKKAAVVRVARWRARHPEQAKASRQATDRKRRDEPGRTWADGKDRLREWIAAHPEQVAESHRLRQAKRRAACRGGSLTATEWQAQLEVFGHCCAYCLASGVKLTIDHVIPLKHGGRHEIDNVVPACGPCNSRKQARGPLARVNVSSLITR